MTQEKPGFKLVNIHDFPGFYESALDAEIDRELESVFCTDDSGCHYSIPDAIYGGSGVEYIVDFSNVRLEQAKEYCDAWFKAFHGETGIEIAYEYESYTSPKEYNFETDRLFAWISDDSIAALYTASEANKHEELAKRIDSRFTSRSGFISGYSNDVGDWLLKPILTWDHNELATLLSAVQSIYCDESNIESNFNTWDLMESFGCYGHLSSAIWEALPPKIREFADAQRENGEEMDFDEWLEQTTPTKE